MSTSSSALTIGTFYIPEPSLGSANKSRPLQKRQQPEKLEKGKPTYDNIRRSEQLTTPRGPMAGSDMSEEQVLFFFYIWVKGNLRYRDEQEITIAF